jgi:hypothetical protein
MNALEAACAGAGLMLSKAPHMIAPSEIAVTVEYQATARLDPEIIAASP